MSNQNNSSNLSMGDKISFIAILLMGIFVFFGMNFITLGDKVRSIVVAILCVVLMTLFVFLAAYAKAQDRNQETWKKVQYAMVALYLLSLIPCYFCISKFLQIQLGKESVMEQVKKDTSDLNKLFNDYSHKCDARASAYQIDLEAMIITKEGRNKLATKFEISDPSSLTKERVGQIAQAFAAGLKGNEFANLEQEKNNLVQSSESNFNNWNIMFIPQYAYELGSAKANYAKELQALYDKTHNDLEKNVPEFNIDAYTDESGILDTFKSADKFSPIGLLVVLFLGFLGLVKYLMGKKSSANPLKRGDSSSITDQGGVVVK